MDTHTKKNRIEIWGDIVNVNDLMKSIAITVMTTMGGYFLAPNENLSLQLFFGLGGAVVGFLICTFFVQPKRNVTIASASPISEKTETKYVENEEKR